MEEHDILADELSRVEAWTAVLKRNNPELLKAIGSRFQGMVSQQLELGHDGIAAAIAQGDGVLESMFLVGVHMGAHLEQLPR